MGDQAYVCSVCTDGKLRPDLERTVLLAPEVEAAVARLARFRQSAGGSGGRPLPVDLAAASDAAAVGNTVSTWARHVAESRGVEIEWPDRSKAYGPLCRKAWSCWHWSCERIRIRPTPVGIQVAAQFLLGQLEWLRHQPEAAEALDELRDAARLLEHLLSGPMDRWYAGPCREPLVDDDGNETDELCAEGLYAAPGAKTVRCRSCGTEHDAAARKEWLLDEAQDALVHAELMARALTAWGVGGEKGVTASRVRGMAFRGRIAAHGCNPAGDPVYRVADVVAVVEEQEAIEADKAQRRQAKAEQRAAGRTVVDTATIVANDRSAAGEVCPERGDPRLSCA